MIAIRRIGRLPLRVTLGVDVSATDSRRATTWGILAGERPSRKSNDVQMLEWLTVLDPLEI